MIILLGNGIVGRAVKKVFEDNGELVIQLIRQDLSLSDSSFEFILEKISKNITKNLNNVEIYRNKHYIINAAAYTNVDKAQIEKDLAFKTNATGTYKLAVAAKSLNIPLIHISTDFIFNGNATKPYTEYDKPQPVNYYGRTKLMAEKMICNSKCDYIIIRTGRIYDEKKGIIKSIVNAIEDNKDLYGVNDQIISPVYSINLAKQIYKLFSLNVRGIFNASSHGSTTPYKLIKFLGKKLKNKEIDVWETQTFLVNTDVALRPKMSLLDNFNLRNLGIDIMPHWKDPIDLVLEKIKNNE